MNWIGKTIFNLAGLLSSVWGGAYWTSQYEDQWQHFPIFFTALLVCVCCASGAFISVVDRTESDDSGQND